MTGAEAIFLGWLIWFVSHDRDVNEADTSIDIHIELPDHEHSESEPVEKL